MAGYKEPGLQDRLQAAAKARETALARLKAKPAADPAVLAERIAREKERETAQALRAAQRAEARELAKAEKARALEENARSVVAPPTEAERKAERDARYAARKARKSSR